jgi:hypothetical protein
MKNAGRFCQPMRPNGFVRKVYPCNEQLIPLRRDVRLNGRDSADQGLFPSNLAILADCTAGNENRCRFIFSRRSAEKMKRHRFSTDFPTDFPRCNAFRYAICSASRCASRAACSCSSRRASLDIAQTHSNPRPHGFVARPRLHRHLLLPGVAARLAAVLRLHRRFFAIHDLLPSPEHVIRAAAGRAGPLLLYHPPHSSSISPILHAQSGDPLIVFRVSGD